MPVAIDAGILSQFLYEDCGELIDFNTGRPIDFAKLRIDGLIEKTEQSKELVIIPAPVLAEALVVVAPDIQKHLDILHSHACFKIVEFGERAAIEVALRSKIALTAKDTNEAIKAPWKKIKYDRQIVAIAKVEGVSVIYSADRFVHQHAKLWGMTVVNISDLPIPKRVLQPRLFEEGIQPTQGRPN